jgi:hypothetical protein
VPDIDGAESARPLRTATAVTVTGVLVMFVGAVIAGRYAPSWFEPEEDCRLLGRCVTPESTAMLNASWWLVGGGFMVVLTGLVLTWRALPRTPRPTTPFPLPVWGRAGSVAIVGLTLSAVLGSVLLISFLVAAQALPVGLCIFWLLQAQAVVGVVRRTGPARRSVRVEWASGLVASAVAVVVGVWLTFRFGVLQFLISDATVLAAAVLLDRALPARVGRPRGSAPVRWAAGTVIAALSVGAVVFVAVPRPDTTDVTPPPAPLLPSPAPPSAASRVPTPAPPTPPPVEASAPCAPADLTWSTAGWEAAMGTRAVTVFATQHGRRPCYLDGFAAITVGQGGRPLQLVVEPGSIAQPSVPVAARRIGVAPGGTASFAVFWKGYGAAADQTTPQSLSVVLPGAAAPSVVPLNEGPAPFDVVDGATVHVDAWRAGLP